MLIENKIIYIYFYCLSMTLQNDCTKIQHGKILISSAFILLHYSKLKQENIIFSHIKKIYFP